MAELILLKSMLEKLVVLLTALLQTLALQTAAVPNDVALGVPLGGKTAVEKAEAKGRRIAEIGFVRKQRINDKYFNGHIEILSMKPIKGGVEILVRAWDKNNNPIGWGDGTVEIEKFIFINPPVMVDDPKGNVVREWADAATGELKKRTLREDPLEAILQSLTHTISVKKEKFDGSGIIEGKIGNTTLTVYPAAGANTPVDGYTDSGGAYVAWATLIARAGNYAAVSDTETYFHGFEAGTTSGTWSYLKRSMFLFDTSALTSLATISSVVMSLYGSANFTADTGTAVTPNIDIYTSTPANTNNLVAADHSQYGTVSQTGSPIAYASWNTAAYNDFTFNATGRGNVSSSGISKFAARNANYDVAAVAPTWSSGALKRIGGYFADQDGTTYDPKLVVEYTLPAVAVKKRVVTIIEE